MKLATRDNGTRDGELILVNRDMTRCLSAASIASTLQAALDEWDTLERPLRELALALEAAPEIGDELAGTRLLAPLPRAYEWVDGSAFVNHVELVRKARGAKPPETLLTDPLVYQGGSGVFLGHQDDIVLKNADWGLDFEAEVCAILGDTPQGVTPEGALDNVKLLLICNDITLRNLIPNELKKGFGFFCSKPATAFSPFAITPDELGSSWSEGRIHLNMNSWLNGEQVGAPNAGPEMHFSFGDLIAHIAKTRSFVAGTILGSGTISNRDPEAGYSCLAEQRMREIIADGHPSTPFLKAGDEVTIDMADANGKSLFGRIHQRVVHP
jgi:fumarylacetoacetate (FAA) hydrolase